MVAPELLNVLCCPETHQPVQLAGPKLLQQLNQAIARGAIRTQSGRTVTEQVVEGLLRSDGKILYPIRNNIPVMLIEEGIEMA
jgi:uncharacterized protein